MNNVMITILLFLIYSIIGWIIEGIDMLILTKKIVNRGFLIGPYCPIYGFGALFIIMVLDKYKSDALVLFVMCVLSCGILEYMTSLIMEKIFKTRWWDYSKNKFNINGRICLETLILFGIGGLIISYFINPFIMNIFNLIPNIVLNILAIIFFVIFIIDVIVSCKVIISFKNTISNVRKDSTDEIKKKVKEFLKSKSKLVNRLANAFPNYELKLRKKN